VTQRVRSDAFADPSTAGDAADDPAGGVPIEAVTVGSPRKIGPSTRSPTARSTARATRGASGVVTCLPPLRSRQRAMATLEAERFDVGADCFGHSQPVQRE
jgi:hypothetical protein